MGVDGIDPSSHVCPVTRRNEMMCAVTLHTHTTHDGFFSLKALFHLIFTNEDTHVWNGRSWSWVAQGFFIPGALIPSFGLTPPFKPRNPKYQSTGRIHFRAADPGCVSPAFCHVTRARAGPVRIARGPCLMTTEVAARVLQLAAA